MTVKKLIKELKEFNTDYEVVIATDFDPMHITDIFLNVSEDENGHEVPEVTLAGEDY